PPSRAEMVSGRQCHFHHRVLRRCACLESHAPAVLAWFGIVRKSTSQKRPLDPSD
ncbi:unnamed protein product, partial [Durusdinium trenchii]